MDDLAGYVNFDPTLIFPNMVHCSIIWVHHVLLRLQCTNLQNYISIEQHKCVDGFSHVHNELIPTFICCIVILTFTGCITTRIVEYLLQAVQHRINDSF